MEILIDARLLQLLLLAVVMKTVLSDDVTSSSQVGLVGQPLLLPCHVTFPTSPTDDVTEEARPEVVRWLRPRDSAPISRDGHVTVAELTSRIRILDGGNLLITYARFPDDNGTWTCLGPRRQQATVGVLILAPPTSGLPRLTPDDVREVDWRSEAWTFTCSSDFAFPPVTLTWKQVSGPPAAVPFVTTLPTLVTSREGLMTSSVRLVLSPVHLGSEFVCTAEHVTFAGRVYTQRLLLRAPTHNNDLEARADLTQISSKVKLNEVSRGVDSALVGVILGLVAVLAILTVIAVIYRRRWHISNTERRVLICRAVTSPRPTDQSQAATTDELLNNRSSAENGQKAARTQAAKLPQDEDEEETGVCHVTSCCAQLSLGVALLALLLLSQLLAVPIYYKGTKPPDLGTDEVLAVTAGSALWLDCRPLIQPISSLVEVTWYHNSDVIYHQQLLRVTGPDARAGAVVSVIGLPANSSAGFMFAARASSNSAGHVTIYPVMPGEQGVFTCAVYSVANDNGRTAVRRKTTMVYVMTGPVVNDALVALLCVAIVTTLLLGLLVGRHFVRFESGFTKRHTGQLSSSANNRLQAAS